MATTTKNGSGRAVGGVGGQQAHSEVRKCAICISFICGEKCEKCARARESISISIPIYVCVCVWVLSVYLSADTNKSHSAKWQKRTFKSCQNREKYYKVLSLSRSKWNWKGVSTRNNCTFCSFKNSPSPPLSLTHSQSVSLFTKTELFPFLMPVKVEESWKIKWNIRLVFVWVNYPEWNERKLFF